MLVSTSLEPKILSYGVAIQRPERRPDRRPGAVGWVMGEGAYFCLLDPFELVNKEPTGRSNSNLKPENQAKISGEPRSQPNARLKINRQFSQPSSLKNRAHYGDKPF